MTFSVFNLSQEGIMYLFSLLFVVLNSESLPNRHTLHISHMLLKAVRVLCPQMIFEIVFTVKELITRRALEGSRIDMLR